MAVESDNDRLQLLTDFGVDATINAATVRGILDREFKVVGDIESEYPVFECRSIDVSGVNHGDTLTYSGTNYEVVGKEDDGEGFTALILIYS